jgi:hypothetical protein
MLKRNKIKVHPLNSKCFLQILICVLIICGCSTTKSMNIKMNDKTTRFEDGYSDYCRINDTLVIDAKKKALISEINSITRKDLSTRMFGGLAGYLAGSALGLGASIPIGMIGCKNESDELDGFGSERGWCKASTIMVVVPISAMTGIIFGSTKSSSEIKPQNIESCDESLHSPKKDYSKTIEIKKKIHRGGLYNSSK